MFRTALATASIVALLISADGCSSVPKRSAGVLEETFPPPSLELQLVDALGERWSIEYVQVYVDGWLVWQGRPDPGTAFLGTHAIPGAGKQELYVRVLARRHNPVAGDLSSKRRMVEFDAGPQTVQIRLSRHAFSSRRINVSLSLVEK